MARGSYTTATASTCDCDTAWVSWSADATSTATMTYGGKYTGETTAWIRWVNDTTAGTVTIQDSTNSDGTWSYWVAVDEGPATPEVIVPDLHPSNSRWYGQSYNAEQRREEHRRAARQEEIDEYERREIAARVKRLEREKDAAELKAKQLLEALIGAVDLGVYEKTGKLFVRGEKHDYIVQKEGFVLKVGKDRMDKLCVHLKDKYSMPDTDNVVALKLMLENEEEKILDMANDHGCLPIPERMPEAACAHWN